jgi:hypothetical protein
MDEALARVRAGHFGASGAGLEGQLSPAAALARWIPSCSSTGSSRFAQAAGITLHIECLYGANNHHIIEGIYKGFARAMRSAVEIDPRKGDADAEHQGHPREGSSLRPREAGASAIWAQATRPPPRGERGSTWPRLASVDYGAGNLRSSPMR